MLSAKENINGASMIREYVELKEGKLQGAGDNCVMRRNNYINTLIGPLVIGFALHIVLRSILACIAVK
jgi:hypothetical protein